MEEFTAAVTHFVVAHQAVAPVVAMLLAVAETTAFLSLLVPSTALLMAVGAAVSTGAMPFMPIWFGAAVGSILGSTFSWWLGRRYGAHVLTLWPMRNNPASVERGREVFAQWGAMAVLIGHFVGPLRAVVFLIAGMSHMSFLRFQAVNIVGAVAWGFIIPKTGELGGDLATWFWHYLSF
jgi:membrane protein DedA with SNARE-associated domain